MTLEELIKKRLADSAKFILERNEYKIKVSIFVFLTIKYKLSSSD